MSHIITHPAADRGAGVRGRHRPRVPRAVPDDGRHPHLCARPHHPAGKPGAGGHEIF